MISILERQIPNCSPSFEEKLYKTWDKTTLVLLNGTARMESEVLESKKQMLPKQLEKIRRQLKRLRNIKSWIALKRSKLRKHAFKLIQEIYLSIKFSRGSFMLKPEYNREIKMKSMNNHVISKISHQLKIMALTFVP